MNAFRQLIRPFVLYERYDLAVRLAEFYNDFDTLLSVLEVVRSIARAQ